QDGRITHRPAGGSRFGAKPRLHLEPAPQLVSPPTRQPRCALRVAFVYEAAANGTGAAVEILVAAPDGEVGLCVVQCERCVAYRVGEIETHYAAGTPGRARDARQVERLARSELHSRPQHQRDLLSDLLQAGVDGLRRHEVLAGVGLQLDHARLRIDAV